jgi:hypothetical protein
MRHQQEFCNLFVARGRPGFDKMIELAHADVLGSWAKPLYARYDRPFNPKDYWRWDSERDGIHLNLNDYLRYFGYRDKSIT